MQGTEPALIRDKESDLVRYRNTANVFWLIVYALPQPSSFFDFAVLTPQMFQSTFDRVAFIDVLMERFVLIAQREESGSC